MRASSGGCHSRDVPGAQIKPYQAFVGGQDFTATGFYSVLGPLMGVPDASRFATEDLVADTLVGGPPLPARRSTAALWPLMTAGRGRRRATATRWQARR